MADRIARCDKGALCTLTLNRPEKLNALDTLAFEELDVHLAELETRTEDIGCVVLRAEGRAFCAGADLAAVSTAPAPASFKLGVIDRMERLPQPIIAAIHGICYTGGLELVLGCDLLVADHSAQFADTHGRWGMVAGWGLTQRLPRRVGRAVAKRMMMTGRSVSAEQALSAGLIDILAGEDGLDVAIDELTTAVLANSWHTNRAIKRAMRETDGMSLQEAIEYDARNFPGVARDAAERIAAFSKK